MKTLHGFYPSDKDLSGGERYSALAQPALGV